MPQANNDIFIRGRSGCLHLRIVTIKLTEPSMDEIPRIFIPKIHMSVAGPAAFIMEYGGYAVQPVSENPSHIRTAATGMTTDITNACYKAYYDNMIMASVERRKMSEIKELFNKINVSSLTPEDISYLVERYETPTKVMKSKSGDYCKGMT
jgi:hypothetical protein